MKYEIHKSVERWNGTAWVAFEYIISFENGIPIAIYHYDNNGITKLETYRARDSKTIKGVLNCLEYIRTLSEGEMFLKLL